MCFHNSMSAKAIKLAARYGRKSDIVEIYQDILDEQYHVNAFNYPKCPIITESDEIQVFNWGLIPFWIKDEKKCRRNKENDPQCPRRYDIRKAIISRTDNEKEMHNTVYRLL